MKYQSAVTNRVRNDPSQHGKTSTLECHFGIISIPIQSQTGRKNIEMDGWCFWWWLRRRGGRVTWSHRVDRFNWRWRWRRWRPKFQLSFIISLRPPFYRFYLSLLLFWLLVPPPPSLLPPSLLPPSFLLTRPPAHNPSIQSLSGKPSPWDAPVITTNECANEPRSPEALPSPRFFASPASPQPPRSIPAASPQPPGPTGCAGLGPLSSRPGGAGEMKGGKERGDEKKEEAAGADESQEKEPRWKERPMGGGKWGPMKWRGMNESASSLALASSARAAQLCHWVTPVFPISPPILLRQIESASLEFHVGICCHFLLFLSPSLPLSLHPSLHPQFQWDPLALWIHYGWDSFTRCSDSFVTNWRTAFACALLC